MRRATAIALLGLAACIEPMGPGDMGVPRHFGVVRGEVPLALLPPEVDRAGNVYVLYGGGGNAEVSAYVGHAGGGWSTGCELAAGTGTDVHGWVGATERYALYWAGTALVELHGDSGGCRRILERDPRTQTDLQFLAVVPRIRETTSADTVVTIVQGGGDRRPYLAVVDVRKQVIGTVRPLEPTGIDSVHVVGVGVDRARETGMVLLSYSVGDTRHSELRFFDDEGRTVGSVAIPADLSQAHVLGELQASSGGLIAGLLDDGRLLRASRSAAGVQEVTEMTPIGVHAHDGALFLVGVAGNRPAAARLHGSDAVVAPVTWELSEQIAASLAGGTAVLDDRSSARSYLRWEGARSAIGTHPLLTPHDPRDYAVDVTGWLIAGPSYDSGGLTYTAIAHAPIGIEYPQ